jgi:hypothetical protein
LTSLSAKKSFKTLTAGLYNNQFLNFYLSVGCVLFISLLDNGTFKIHNEDKSGASYCHQVTGWVSDMFHNFYIVKNHKNAKK